MGEYLHCRDSVLQSFCVAFAIYQTWKRACSLISHTRDVGGIEVEL